MSATTYGWLVLAFPLLGTLIIAFGYRVTAGHYAGWIGTAAIGLAFLAALGALIALQGTFPSHRELESSLWNYASTVGINARLSILVDPLSVYMILIVTGISTMIHLYSVSYLEEDRGIARYFAYLNFFVFSMLLLVLAGNFLLLIVGWAFVGAASYLLISFWYRRTHRDESGDQGVRDQRRRRRRPRARHVLHLQAHRHAQLPRHVQGRPPRLRTKGEADIVAGCLLLLVGAIAKSAQVPLHTWLPDAMEGPTPVSALIHAATMVTAGVYLIARMHVLFELAPAAQDTGAVIGAATLLIAGTIALTQTDIKRVIAYSTMSQIGYMIMGVSVGAYAAGMFHLMTHAFFKALLFMGAGSIIGAMGGEQSLQKMGGFRKALPFTFACFIIGGLALSGIPPFSGFFSKDDILLVTRRARRLALGAVRGRLRRRVPDGDLHVPDDLPRLLRRPRRRGAGARRRPPPPRGGPDEPCQRRGRGHRRRLPRPAPHGRRARDADEGRDDRARDRRGRRRPRAGPGGRRRDRQLPAPHVRRLAAV